MWALGHQHDRTRGGNGIFVLPSRGRPHNIARFITEYKETGATTPVWLRLDDDDPSGYVCDHPNWIVEIGQRVPLSEIYNDAYWKFPGSAWFGFIADDVVPKTNQWDTRLIEAAGRDGMAVPSGGHDPNGAPHFVLGGDLVRSIGWLCLPGLHRLYIDTVWLDIATQRGVLRRVPEVLLEHLHFSNGKALMDQTYRKPNREADRKIYTQWRNAW